MQQASDAMEECRKLDLADRYLNTKSTVFLMNADRVEQADATVELFITDADGNKVSLSEMQCVWYEQSAAESYLRQKEIGKSLKKALSINSVSFPLYCRLFHFTKYTRKLYSILKNLLKINLISILIVLEN